MFIHVVKPGETLTSIAANYGVTVQRIISDNGVLDTENLAAGQALVILIPKTIHIVSAGETLQSIAQQYGITEMELIQNNPAIIQNMELIPGQVLAVSFINEKSGTILVNSYAYPGIEKDVLEYALPFVSRLTIFGYGFTKDGELIGVDDSYLISKAYEYKTAPIMLISSIDELGDFNNKNASYIFSNPEPQQKLIDNIIKTMKEKGYLGLDIDFEFIAPEDKEAYIQFIRNITEQLHKENFTVNVDLAPKTSPDQKGLLYEAHDYKAIGEIVDTVLIMAYEWGYTYTHLRYML